MHISHEKHFPVEFTKDLFTAEGKKESFCEYQKREPGGDLTFISAWHLAMRRAGEVSQESDIYDLLHSVNELATKHLLSHSTMNSIHFCKIKKSFCANKRGLLDLIDEIWQGNKFFTLRGRASGEDGVSLDYRGFSSTKTNYSSRPLEKDDKEEIRKYFLSIFNGNKLSKENEPNDKEKEKISKILQSQFDIRSLADFTNKDWEELVDCSRKGESEFLELFAQFLDSKGGVAEDSNDGQPQISLTSIRSIERAKKLCEEYWYASQKELTEDEKIEQVAILCRKLAWQHIFPDGNDRSIFMLANALLKREGLPLFYPKNICFFDFNSIPKIVEEIKEGQRRFKEFFCTEEELAKGLKAYVKAIQEITNTFQKVLPVLSDEEIRDLTDALGSRDVEKINELRKGTYKQYMVKFAAIIPS